MAKNPISMYYDYIKEGWDRRSLIEGVVEKYTIKSAIYPGSYIHVTPSFIIPDVVYVDSDKKAKKFFASEEVYTFIAEEKVYAEDAQVRYYASDYSKNFMEKDETFDLMISQYAGFISQACKKYLKPGGILIANNSHGDAGVAFCDKDYSLIAVGNQRDGKWVISEKNMESYFIPKKAMDVTKEYLMTLNRGIGYMKSAGIYIFRKNDV